MLPEDTVKKVTVQWLKANVTGCMFATKFASAGSAGLIRPHVLTEVLTATHLAEQLEPLLVDAAAHSEAALLIFPDLRRDEDIARLIDKLGRYVSWTVSEIEWKDFPRSDLLVGLDWRTPTGHFSTAMGMAPLATMPVTRRSPYVTLAIWPGGHENPFRPSDRARVSLADMKHGLDAYTHDKFWHQTKATVLEHLDGQQEGAAQLRVSFCLRSDVRPLISVLPPTPSA